MNGRWKKLAAAFFLACLVFFAGCGLRSVPPLPPLPESRMPDEEALMFTPHRLVIAPGEGRHKEIEQVFAARLHALLPRLGIVPISSDELSNRIVTQLMERQVRETGEAVIRDPEYQQLQAEAVITVHVTAVQTVKDNDLLTFNDGDGVRLTMFESKVTVSGYCNIVWTETGEVRTVPFNGGETVRALNRRIRLSTENLASAAARDAVLNSDLFEVLRSEFPLVGYVVGKGKEPLLLIINRGRRHGITENHKWELLVENRQVNELTGKLYEEKVIGTAETVDLQREYCVVKCDAKAVRLKAKLGMKAKAVVSAPKTSAFGEWTQALPLW